MITTATIISVFFSPDVGQGTDTGGVQKEDHGVAVLVNVHHRCVHRHDRVSAVLHCVCE